MTRTTTKLVLTFGIACTHGAALAQHSDSTIDIDRAYAAELRADASRHASLLQAGGSGHDVAFHVGDSWGNNRLNIHGHLATRWIGNLTDEGDSGAVSEGFTHGFEQQFATVAFTGNIVNPQMRFNIEVELGQADRTEALPNILREAWAQYDFVGEVDGFYVRWGQFKTPLLNEENIHNGKQLAVARGPVNEFFNPSWSEGVMVGYRGESFSMHGAITDGVRTPFPTLATGTTAGTPFSGNDADIALTLRADYKFSGAWEQFDDFTSFRGSDTAFKLGGGFHYQSGADTGQAPGGIATNDSEYWMVTVDAQYENDGWHLAAGYISHTIDINMGPDATDHGVYVQGGMFVADQWELFGRWDWLTIDDEITGGGNEDFHFLTVGANYYFVPVSHVVKFTGDVLYAIDDSIPGGMPAIINNQGDTGLLLSTDGEVAVRMQVSVLF